MAEVGAFLKLADGRVVVGDGHFAWHARKPDQPSFYANDFFMRSLAPWLTFENIRILPSDQFFRAKSTDRHRVDFSQPARSTFLDTTKRLLEDISQGKLEKAVPIVFETADENSVSWSERLSRLSDQPKQFEYGFSVEDEAMIGVSPEILFEVRGRELSTMALAGTAPIHGSSLLDNSKERREHQIVVDDLRERLSQWGSVTIEETREHELSTLRHLMTPIRMSAVGDLDFENLLRRLHPTPALGGFPREAALDWLRSQPEAAVRSRFGAPFGFVDGDFAFAIVAIRGLQRHSGKWWLGSGCGVVEGSEPEKEWEELRLKRDSVKRLLGFEI